VTLFESFASTIRSSLKDGDLDVCILYELLLVRSSSKVEPKAFVHHNVLETRINLLIRPRGNGPFQVLERINDNAYKIDLLGEYNVSSTFTVSDLSLFDVEGESDLRTNPSQEGENDGGVTMTKDKDPLEELGGPMTRSRAKKGNEALQQVLSIIIEYMPKFNGEKTKVVNCIVAQMEED